MGRSNVCTTGKYEGLYYIDYDYFKSEFIDESTGLSESEFSTEEFNYSLEQFKKDFMKKYKSFYEIDEFISGTEHAILENELFYVVTEDNEHSIAIKLIQKDNDYCSYQNLQAGLYKAFLNGLKNCLFNQFEEIGIYAGPWTSGRIQKSYN